jgi:hypothetical protein
MRSYGSNTTKRKAIREGSRRIITSEHCAPRDPAAHIGRCVQLENCYFSFMDLAGDSPHILRSRNAAHARHGFGHFVNILEIGDAMRTVLSFPVDYIAYQNRGAYEIVLDVCMNTQTGQVSATPIFEPMFEVADHGLCFDAQADKSNLTIPWAAASRVAELPTALHHLISAVRYPRHTFEYCRMAAEMVRAHFAPSTTGKNEKRWIQGELAMCKTLRVTRKSLMELEGLAARSRHGKLVDSISWPLRKRALEFAWELVAWFINYLEDKPNDHWKELDVRLEGYAPRQLLGHESKGARRRSSLPRIEPGAVGAASQAVPSAYNASSGSRWLDPWACIRARRRVGRRTRERAHVVGGYGVTIGSLHHGHPFPGRAGKRSAEFPAHQQAHVLR